MIGLGEGGGLSLGLSHLGLNEHLSVNGRHLPTLMYTHSSMGWWGPEGLDMGVINVPSIPQPRPTTLFFQGLFFF